MKGNTPWYIIAMCIALSISGTTRAEETISLSVETAVKTALNQNPEILAAQLDKQARLTGIAEEEAKFGRTLSLQMLHSDNREPSVSLLDEVPTATTNNQRVSFVVGQRLKSGGVIDVAFSQNRTSDNAGFRTINPVYNAGMTASFTQPLLQGRGNVNKIGMEIAEHNYKQAEIDQEGYHTELTANVRIAYWNLVLANEQFKTKQQLYDGGKRVLETVQTRIDMGAEARNSILQAELGVARREEDIIIAEDRVRDAEDRLKTLMGIKGKYTLRILPTESPEITPFSGTLEEGIQSATTHNTAYRRTSNTVATGRLLTEQAKDQTKPEINLTFKAGLSGIGGNYTDDLRGLGGADGRAWQGGFAINLPLGSNANRERYQQRLMELESSELKQNYHQMQLVESVRERHRQVSTDQRRAKVSQLTEQLAERNVREEEERLSLGLSTVREVLDAQDDLAEARANRLQAVVDYQKALIAWDRITGR